MRPRRTVSLLVTTILLTSACSTQRQLAERGRRGFKQRGLASWYGPGFDGKLTANGEVYDMDDLTAAHKELPFDTVVEVLNHDNGRAVRVRINDRGPFVRGRIIDLSRAAAEKIGLVRSGVAKVTLSVVATGRTRSDPTANTSAWLVQAGAFRNRPSAERQLQEVRAVDHRARLQQDQGLLRVVVGPFNREKEARRVLAALAKNRIDALLRRLP